MRILRRLIPAVLAAATLCTFGLASAASAQTATPAVPAHAVAHMARATLSAPPPPCAAGYEAMTDGNGLYLTFNGHGNALTVKSGGGACVRTYECTDRGIYCLYENESGLCADAAGSYVTGQPGPTMYAESCVSSSQFEQFSVSNCQGVYCVWQNNAWTLNLTDGGLAGSVVWLQGGGRTTDNIWDGPIA